MNRFLSVAGYGKWKAHISELKDVYLEFVARAKAINLGTLKMATEYEQTGKMSEGKFSPKRFLQWCDEFEEGNVALLILYVEKEYRNIARMEIELGTGRNASYF